MNDRKGEYHVGCQLSIPASHWLEQLSTEIPLPIPKFQIGQSVYWAHVPSHDFGRIIGVVYTNEASTQATGYHYAIQLDPRSPSYADGTRSDWAFEEDLELLPPNDATNGHQEN